MVFGGSNKVRKKNVLKGYCFKVLQSFKTNYFSGTFIAFYECFKWGIKLNEYVRYFFSNVPTASHYIELNINAQKKTWFRCLKASLPLSR